METQSNPCLNKTETYKKVECECGECDNMKEIQQAILEAIKVSPPDITKQGFKNLVMFILYHNLEIKNKGI